jgi:hypothetical protein
MDWRGYKKKQACSNLWYYCNICLEGLNYKKSQSVGRDLNLWPPEYEAGGLSSTVMFDLVSGAQCFTTS